MNAALYGGDLIPQLKPRKVAVLLSAALSAVSCAPLLAQKHAAGAREVTVLASVFEALAPRIAEAAFSDSNQPWEIRLPGDRAPWPAALRHLERVLRARKPTSGDRDVKFLRLRQVSSPSDSVVEFNLEVGDKARCPPPSKGWQQGGLSFTFRFRKLFGVWKELPAGPPIDFIPGVCR